MLAVQRLDRTSQLDQQFTSKFASVCFIRFGAANHILGLKNENYTKFWNLHKLIAKGRLDFDVFPSPSGL